MRTFTYLFIPAAENTSGSPSKTRCTGFKCYHSHSPSSFYSIGPHGDRLPAPSLDLDDTIPGRLANSPSRPQSFTPTSSSANEYARPCRLCSKQKEIQAGPDSGYPVSRNSFTSGLRGSFPSRVQSLGDSCSRTPSILLPCTTLYSSVPAHGVTQLGLGSHPSGSLVPDTPSTSFSFIRSDRPVYVTASVRSSGPCQPPTALAGPTFSYLRNPSPHVSGRKPHISCLELKVVFHALQHWAQMLPGHQVMIATDNSTVVSYINKQGGTHSPTLLRLTVELLLWLEAQNIIVGARHIPGCLNVIADHLSLPNQPILTEWSRNRGTYLQGSGTPEVDMFATLSNSHLPRFMSPIAEPRALAVDALSQDWQGRSMHMFPPFPLLNKVMQKLRSTQMAEVILVAPWWPSQSWFPHLLRLCVEHSLVLPYRRDLLSQQDQKYISDGKSYHQHVWRLSCDTIKQQAFQTRSLGSRQPLGGPQPIACTMIDGFASLDGPQDKVLIHLIPQPLR